MKLEFDPAKNARNIRERGLSFDLVRQLDWERALYGIDDRADYGELRRVAIAPLDGRLHFVCFVEIPGGIRVVSFRKTNPRENRKYAEETANE